MSKQEILECLVEHIKKLCENTQESSTSRTILNMIDNTETITGVKL